MENPSELADRRDRKNQLKQHQKFYKAIEKAETKEFKKYKKKLTKKQVKELDTWMEKQRTTMNNMIEGLALANVKKLGKRSPFLKMLAVPYIKYTLLKMERVKYPKYNGPGPDPYTCGPEYFPHYTTVYVPSHAHYWDNDRR